MTSRPHRVVLTYADLREMPDDRNRYEILEGDLVVTPAPNTSHQGASMGLTMVLGSHIRERKLGKLFAASTDVILSDITVVEPDLLFVSRERLAIVESAAIRGAPDLVVEILSPTTVRRDREAKRQIYPLHGIPNYWIVDPVERRIEAHVLSGSDYVLSAQASGEESFRAPPFPELTIPLSEVWA